MRRVNDGDVWATDLIISQNQPKKGEKNIGLVKLQRPHPKLFLFT